MGVEAAIGRLRNLRHVGRMADQLLDDEMAIVLCTFSAVAFRAIGDFCRLLIVFRLDDEPVITDFGKRLVRLKDGRVVYDGAPTRELP